MRHHILGILIVLIIQQPKAKGQTIFLDTLKANNYRNLADSLLSIQAYKESGKYYFEAAKIYQKHNILEDYLGSLNNYGNALVRDGDYTKAHRILKQALQKGIEILGENHLIVSNSHNVFGNLWLAQGNYQQAVNSYNRTLNIRLTILEENSQTLGSTYYNLALAEIRHGSYSAAAGNIEKSLSIARLHHGEQHHKVAECYNELGNISLVKNDFDDAKKYYEKALQIRLKVFKQENIHHGISYNNLGQAHLEEGSFGKAIDFYSKSLRIFERQFGKENFYTAHLWKNIGSANFGLGKYELAVQNFELGLTMWLKIYGESHPDLTFFYSNIGEAYGNRGDYEKADHYFKKSLAVQLSHSMEEHPSIAYTYNSIGNLFDLQDESDSAIYFYEKAASIREQLLNGKGGVLSDTYRDMAKTWLKKGNTDKSMTYYQRSLSACSKEFSYLSSWNENPMLEDVLFPVSMLSALKGKAYSLREIYGISKEEKYLKSAFSTILLSIKLMDQIRIGYNQESAKQNLTKLHKDLFKVGLSVAIELYDLTQESAYKNRAWEIAEKSKAFILEQSLYEKSILSFFAMPDSLLKKEKLLQQNISIHKKEIYDIVYANDDQDDVNLARLEDLLFNEKRSLEKLVKEFEEDYPRYYQLKYDANTLSIHQVQQKLQIDEILIEYFWNDSLIHCFLIEPGSFQMKEIVLGKDFRTTSDSIVTMTGVMDRLNYTLSQVILEDLSSNIKKITIIPDGPLWDLDFGLLHTEDPKGGSPKEIPYLFKKYNISYAYSTSLLFQEKDHNKKPKKSLLAFSFGELDVDIGDQIGLDKFRSLSNELPGTRSEIRSIANFIAGDYYFGKLANEKQFKQVASNYQILHLALHGETDDRVPENSRLYFYSKGDTIEDGKLHAFELYNMDLNADLAVLSACNTGSGEIVKGEGIMSLGRAFAYAGVNSLLLTRHDVSDAVAPQIMEIFYRELKKGKRKSEALRQAKLEFLENANNITADPYYWSSFYILGDDKPIEFNGDNNYWKYLIGILIILGLICFLFRKRYSV